MFAGCSFFGRSVLVPTFAAFPHPDELGSNSAGDVGGRHLMRRGLVECGWLVIGFLSSDEARGFALLGTREGGSGRTAWGEGVVIYSEDMLTRHDARRVVNL